MDFQTPSPVAEYMSLFLPPSPHIKTVLEPTPGRGNLVRMLKQMNYKVFVPLPHEKNFWYSYKTWVATRFKFDACVMNPPFSPMSEGYKILQAVMNLTDRIVALMPWLTIINSERRTKILRDFGLRSVTHLPRSVFPGSRVQTCILDLSKGWKYETKFLFYGE